MEWVLDEILETLSYNSMLCARDVRMRETQVNSW